MRTVIIWDQCGQEQLLFFVVDGDLSELDGVYLNGCGDEEKVDKLNSIIYRDDYSSYRNFALTKFPVDAVKNGAKVIVCGFYP